MGIKEARFASIVFYGPSEKLYKMFFFEPAPHFGLFVNCINRFLGSHVCKICLRYSLKG